MWRHISGIAHHLASKPVAAENQRIGAAGKRTCEEGSWEAERRGEGRAGSETA